VGGRATGNALLAPEPAAGIGVKSTTSIGVMSGKWLTLLQAHALPNAPDIATTQGLRDRAIIAVQLGCALHGRCSGGFTPEVTVAVGHASTAELSVW